ncbi:MAG: holo-ACP synthase [Bacillota bacterium]|nr:holo-ACP synthase [Bacillota bacterium]HHT90512.1 holo-ACP synthase [Bacillota bacterium]
MSVKGCGVDLVEIARIARALDRRGFQDKIYTPRERSFLEGRSPQSWAARFAAKEAVMKALGRGWQQGVPFASIEIFSDALGQPQVRLLEPAGEIARQLGISRFVLSLAHTKELAIAYVIALGGIGDESCDRS